MAPSTVSDARPSSLEEYWRARTRSDDKESIASLKSNFSIASGRSRGKKRKLICTSPDIPEDLVRELRAATAVDIGVEMIRRVEEIIMVAITSSNPKGTYIKIFKEAATFLAVGTMELSRRIGPACGTQAPRLAEASPSLLEEENEALRKELPKMPVSASQKYSQCNVSASESGCPPRNG